jgi:hypothetical protein
MRAPDYRLWISVALLVASTVVALPDQPKAGTKAAASTSVVQTKESQSVPTPAKVAGNVVNVDNLGSLEYAVKVVGVKTIVVMGHTACGAVKGAIDKVKLGNLTELVAKIQPAVAASGPGTTKDHAYVDKVGEQNVRQSIKEIREKVPSSRRPSTRAPSPSMRTIKESFGRKEDHFSASVRAARDSRRVESRGGSTDSSGRTRSGISVQASATASQPRSARRAITRL